MSLLVLVGTIHWQTLAVPDTDRRISKVCYPVTANAKERLHARAIN